MNARERAEIVYQRVHPTEAQIRFMGGIEHFSAVQRATVEQIAEHIQNCEDAAKAAGLAFLDYEKVEFGTGRDEIFAIAASKRKSSNRRAGARALVNKYGKSAAEDIIARKTGRRYSLKG